MSAAENSPWLFSLDGRWSMVDGRWSIPDFPPPMDDARLRGVAESNGTSDAAPRIKVLFLPHKKVLEKERSCAQLRDHTHPSEQQSSWIFQSRTRSGGARFDYHRQFDWRSSLHTLRADRRYHKGEHGCCIGHLPLRSSPWSRPLGGRPLRPLLPGPARDHHRREAGV